MSQLTTIQFSQSYAPEELPLDLNSPILLSIDEYDRGAYKPVFEEFIGMPLGCKKPLSSNVILFLNKAILSLLNGKFSPPQKMINVGDYVYCSLYVEIDDIVNTLKNIQLNGINHYSETVKCFESKLFELKTKKPNPEIIRRNLEDNPAFPLEDYYISIAIRLKHP